MDMSSKDFRSTNSATKRGNEIFMVGCDFSTFAHELGHVLGLEHAGARVEPRAAAKYGLPPFLEYLDVSSTMSAQFSRTGSMHGQRRTRLRGLSAFEVYRLGGLTDAQIASATEGRTELRLASLSVNRPDGPSAARVVLPAPAAAAAPSAERRVVVWLEWRERVNQDADLDMPLCATEFNFPLVNTLLVRRVLAGGVTSLLAVVPAGRAVVINGVLFRYAGHGRVTVDFAACKTAPCVQKEAGKVVRKLKRARRRCSSRACARRAEKSIRKIRRLDRRVRNDNRRRRTVVRALERCGARRGCRKKLRAVVARIERRVQRHVRREERALRKAIRRVKRKELGKRAEKRKEARAIRKELAKEQRAEKKKEAKAKKKARRSQQ